MAVQCGRVFGYYAVTALGSHRGTDSEFYLRVWYTRLTRYQSALQPRPIMAVGGFGFADSLRFLFDLEGGMRFIAGLMYTPPLAVRAL